MLKGSTYLFQLFFLTSGEVQHFIRVFDQNSTLRFRLGNVESRCENGNFSSCNLLDATCTQTVNRQPGTQI